MLFSPYVLPDEPEKANDIVFHNFSHVLECWRINGQDDTLLATLFDQLLTILAKSLPFEERQSYFDKKIVTRTATLQPVAVSRSITNN